MSRLRIALLFLSLVVLGAGLGACGGDDDEAGDDGGATTAAASGSTLNGSVGPGFEISLDDADGVSAGTYTLVVDDQSPSHNFHLTGPGGVDVSTGVGDEGEESFEVTLEPGEYTFLCDPHASQMRGSFTVG